MKFNFLIISIPSVIALFLIIWHLIVFRSKKTAFYFIFFGLIFGFLRAKIIYLIQIVSNKSFIPYQFNNSFLRIGNDSLQVYAGWIIASYLAWCLAEFLLKSFSVNNKKDYSNKIFPIISLSFLILAAFSYAIETTSSFMGWWSWNQFLTANASKSIFINVPWVGIIDWASVAFEFLGIFFLVRYAFLKKKWAYLSIFLLPALHWSSHLYFNGWWVEISGISVTPSLAWHLIMIVIPIILLFLKSPELDEELKLKITKKTIYKHRRLIWAAFFIIFGVNLLCDLLVGKDWHYLISLVPLSLIVLISLDEIKLESLFKLSTILIVILFFCPLDILTKQRIVVAFFPVLFFAIFVILEKLNLINQEVEPHCLKKIGKKIVPAIFISTIIVFSAISTKNFIASKKISQSQIPASQKKFILVTIDTLRQDHLGVYGYKKPTSLNIDNFAKESIIFNNAYSPIPYTLPAHASLMTGLYPKNNKVIDNASKNVDISNVSLAEMFHDKGYKTAGFVSWESLNTEYFQKGFEILDFGNSDDNLLQNQQNPEQKTQMPKERTAEQTNKKVFEWLDQNYKSDFFLWIHYYEPHAPYNNLQCKGAFSKELTPSSKDLIEGELKKIGQKNLYKKNIFQKNDLDYLMAKYDEEILCTDKNFGDLASKLKTLGIYSDITMIVAGDHGENFDHNYIFHGGNLYESAIKIPLILKSPLLKTDFKQIEQPVSLIDIFPTLSDLFRLSDNDLNIDGKNIKTIIDQKISRDLFFETKFPIFDKPNSQNNPNFDGKKAVLNKNEKLIVSNDYTEKELYNVSLDKKEQINKFREDQTLTETLLKKIKSFFSVAESKYLSPEVLK